MYVQCYVTLSDTHVPYHGTRTCVRTMVRVYHWYTCTYMLCHNFLIGKGHTCVLGGHTAANAGQHTPTLSLPPSHHCLNGEFYRARTCVRTRVPKVRAMVPWYVLHMYVYVRTYVRTYVHVYVRTYAIRTYHGMTMVVMLSTTREKALPWCHELSPTLSFSNSVTEAFV